LACRCKHLSPCGYPQRWEPQNPRQAEFGRAPLTHKALECRSACNSREPVQQANHDRKREQAESSVGVGSHWMDNCFASLHTSILFARQRPFSDGDHTCQKSPPQRRFDGPPVRFILVNGSKPRARCLEPSACPRAQRHNAQRCLPLVRRLRSCSFIIRRGLLASE
jgi:hypothetical protein